jgi:hypothetical protein
MGDGEGSVVLERNIEERKACGVFQLEALAALMDRLGAGELHIGCLAHIEAPVTICRTSLKQRFGPPHKIQIRKIDSDRPSHRFVAGLGEISGNPQKLRVPSVSLAYILSVNFWKLLNEIKVEATQQKGQASRDYATGRSRDTRPSNCNSAHSSSGMGSDTRSIFLSTSSTEAAPTTTLVTRPSRSGNWTAAAAKGT